MGRKSALTEEGWAKAIRRVLIDGESVNSVAKDIGINEASLRRKINPNKSEGEKHTKPLKQLAIEKVNAENAVKQISEEIAELPYVSQQIVGDLARKLANISFHLGSASEYGAMTAHRLMGIAHQQSQVIDDAEPLSEQSMEALKGIRALAVTANDASLIGRDLLKANKEAIDDLNKQADKPEPKQIVFTVTDASA